MALSGLCLSTLLLAGSLSAQTLPAQTRDTPLFRVELVIFAHEGGALETAEDFLVAPPALPEPVLESIELTVSVRGDLGARPDRADTPRLEPVALPPRLRPPPPLEPVALPTWRQLLDTSAGELVAVYRRLAAQSGYRPLMHLIWEQPGEVDQPAPVVGFERLRLGSDELVGAARLSRSRFLHLQLDLEFLNPEDGVAVPRPMGDDGTGEVRLLVPRYRIEESRRMRSGEVHYFDHPAFGVIATIQPVERRDTGVTMTR